MGICVNYDCQRPTFGRKIRCGVCRQKTHFTCMDCGQEHQEPRALRCKDCYKINFVKIHRESAKKWQEKNRPVRHCINCYKELPLRHSKFCSIECWRKVRRPNTRTCGFCDKVLNNRQKITCGSKDCMRQYNVAWCNANRERRTQYEIIRKKQVKG